MSSSKRSLPKIFFRAEPGTIARFKAAAHRAGVTEQAALHDAMLNWLEAREAGVPLLRVPSKDRVASIVSDILASGSPEVREMTLEVLNLFRHHRVVAANPGVTDSGSGERIPQSRKARIAD